MLDPPVTATVNPPKQSRSRRTLERIVKASLEILDEEGPSGLTVHAVVERADSSVGSFYARFGGKDDLLDYLGERVWHEALERWNEALVSRDWSVVDLPGLIEGALGLLMDAQRSRSVYMRALDRAAGRDGEAYAAFRSQLLSGIGDLILARRAEVAHPDPELAVRLGLRAAMGVVEANARDGADGLGRETLVAECRSLLLAYLTGSAEGGDGEGVDFFDVWG